MERAFTINRERRGLSVSVKSGFTGLQIKSELDRAEKAGGNIFVPGELTKDPEGYSVYIRQKLSLKTFLSSEKPGEELKKCLLRSLCGLANACKTNGLRFNWFLFDLDAVFISGIMEKMEFAYLPGLRTAPGDNSVSELLAMVLLYCDRYDSEDLLVRASGIIGRAEKEGAAFPAEEVEALLGRKKRFHLPEFIKTGPKPARNTGKALELLLKRPELAGIIIFLLAGLVLASRRAEAGVWITWLLLAGAVVGFSILQDKGKTGVGMSYYLRHGPDMPGGELTVGRDPGWASLLISDARVSRRHAVLTRDEAGLRVRDLFSANGTYINGKRLTAGEEVLVGKGEKISFGLVRSFDVAYGVHAPHLFRKKRKE